SYLNSQVQTNDIIVAGSSSVYFNHRYYNTTATHPLVYAPYDLPHFSGTALLDEEDLLHDFSEIDPKTTVWKIDTTGFKVAQPKVPPSWSLQSAKIFPDLYIYRGEIVVRKYVVE
ncbi:MAG: hypothetical protein QF775_03715, partial [archaeon]|nr:hypothetical protein [archaeon]